MLRLAAEDLLPGIGRRIELSPIDVLREHRGRGVADGEAFAAGGDPVGVRHAHAGCRAVPGEHHVAIELDLSEVRELAVRRGEGAHVGQLELLDDVGHPVAAERLPGENIDAARAEQRPQRHLDRARVRGGHQRHPIVRRQFEQGLRLDERRLDPCLGLRLAVVAAEQRALQRLERPAFMLGAGAGGEARIFRPQLGFRYRRHGSSTGHARPKCRASRTCGRNAGKDVDGRDKPGHDRHKA